MPALGSSGPDTVDSGNFNIMSGIMVIQSRPSRRASPPTLDIFFDPRLVGDDRVRLLPSSKDEVHRDNNGCTSSSITSTDFRFRFSLGFAQVHVSFGQSLLQVPWILAIIMFLFPRIPSGVRHPALPRKRY
ncbi:hypothetical protein E4U21_006243 [Claviceps maximensis]|nr:hypothetical protein E4U21_006243 [Claviceps maximensis]